jgi:hypothetical protein
LHKTKWKKAQAKIPGQSWTVKEKLDVVNAILADERFSHAEARAAATMVLYYHNTTSGELFPSRQQVAEHCHVGKRIVINTTRKMRSLGYVHYEQTTGGRNERNTYYLKKRCEQSTLSTPVWASADMALGPLRYTIRR